MVNNTLSMLGLTSIAERCRCVVPVLPYRDGLPGWVDCYVSEPSSTMAPVDGTLAARRCGSGIESQRLQLMPCPTVIIHVVYDMDPSGCVVGMPPNPPVILSQQMLVAYSRHAKDANATMSVPALGEPRPSLPEAEAIAGHVHNCCSRARDRQSLTARNTTPACAVSCVPWRHSCWVVRQVSL